MGNVRSAAVLYVLSISGNLTRLEWVHANLLQGCSLSLLKMTQSGITLA